VGGWISGGSRDPADAEAADLLELQARFPDWHIWRGKHTGHWWAAPPTWAPQALIDAATLGELAPKISDVETWRSGG
jgi:hypothetical protein